MKTDEADLTPTERKNLPKAATHLIADAKNDITIPYFSGALRPVDDTLLMRGGGKGLKIYDEIERDTHAFAMLQKRKKTLVGREWIVKPASDDPLDIKAADIVRAQLEALPFDSVCDDLLDATLKGYAVSETIWERRDGMIAIKKIVSHDQRRFVFDEEWNPRLLTYTSMTDGIELPPRKFLVHRHGVKGNNPYGLGLGSRLFWATLFKREGVTFWLHFLEKFAGPTVIAETPYTTLGDEQKKLLDTLRNVRTASAITVPIGTDVKFLEAARSGSVSYEGFLAYWDKQISICVTGETLTTDVGAAGSKAASTTHENILEKLVDSDGDLLSDTLHEQVIQWIVDYNVPGAQAPRVWRIRATNEKDEAEVVEAQAKANASRDKALRIALATAATLKNDDDARNYIIASGVADHLPEETIEALVAARHSKAGEDKEAPSFAAPQTRKKKAHDIGHAHVCLSEPDSPVMRLTDDLEIAAEDHFTKRIEAMRQAVNADTADEASRNLLDLAAKWTPNVLGRLLGLSTEVASLQGREAVFEEMNETALEETAFANEVGAHTFQEQIDFLRQKRGIPTERWTDLMRGGHDRAFAVAGATDLEMVAEFQSAVLQATKDWDKSRFAGEFDRIVEKYGWSYKGGRTWRIRTIFATNIRTSYMAGRLAQMRDPDVVRLRPYWQYRHADAGIPKDPRPQHVAWDGLVLMHDDPWWDIHFPPNDWHCSCGVHTLSRGDLRRLGKDGPDNAPDIIRDPIIDKVTGEPSEQPRGIGYGWDYQPGNDWEDGLMPKRAPKFQSLDHAKVQIDAAQPMDDLLATAKPATVSRLLPDATVQDSVRAFLEPFGADIGHAVPFEDRTGALLTASDQLFRDGSGELSVNPIMAPYLGMLAEAIRDPDEIWLGLSGKEGARDNLQVDRRFVRADPISGRIFAFLLGNNFWRALDVTRSTSDELAAWRRGKLLWKRNTDDET